MFFTTGVPTSNSWTETARKGCCDIASGLSAAGHAAAINMCFFIGGCSCCCIWVGSGKITTIIGELF